MKQFKLKKKQGGFTLLDLGITIVIVGAIAGGIYLQQGKSEGNQGAQDVATALGNVASKIHRFAGITGTYTALTPAMVNNMISLAPLVFAGGNIVDPWGNTVNVVGNAANATPSFVLTAGGATGPLDKETCTTIATQLASKADVVVIAAAATITTANGLAGPVASAYKAAGGALSTANLSAGCSAVNPQIAFQFR